MLFLDIHVGHGEDSPELPHTTSEKIKQKQFSDIRQLQAVTPEKRDAAQEGPPIADASCLEGGPPREHVDPTDTLKRSTSHAVM